jgi:maleylacetoacetate isomerase
MTLTLYSYWRSTTSVRVRAALNLKGLAYQIRSINLIESDHLLPEYGSINPNKGVPSLVLKDGRILTQSMAILRYLDELEPDPPLLPNDPVERAQVEAAAHVLALDVHPVNNLRVGQYLKSIGHSQDDVIVWMRHWMSEGFDAFQTMIRCDTRFAFGDTPGLADLCLVAQLYNGRRWGVDLTPFARLVDIDAAAQEIEAIAKAMPDAQPDATV